ncbi:glutamine amidotransferase family protein [Candidatus Sumerlaeota bacterium]|nr:glutamine amidotransferase family protein [Candidatus Sumerlaeota bacterium]
MLRREIPDYKDISGCSIAGIMSENGECFSGSMIMESIANMHNRSNGLGGGFAVYGIYPEYQDYFALHIMYEGEEGARNTERYLQRMFIIHHKEVIPHRHDTCIKNHPLIRRYFVTPQVIREDTPDRIFEKISDEDYVFRAVMEINMAIEGAFVFSSGKNMGIFKGVGYPEDIGEFYQLDQYKGYIWIAHGRFPTNTTGWWGGAHPFGLLEWAVVHNGEISSYGINRRYLANFGYHCALQTDTEVIVYLFDLLVRKHRMPLEAACMAMAPPFWEDIARMDEEPRDLARTIRMVYGGALLNGPFSIILSHSRGMTGLNDRIKLRPMVAAKKDDVLFLASEESAVRVICREPDMIWHVRGGTPVSGRLKYSKEKRLATSVF